ncbi:MAG: hypothetical protein P8N09_00935 [Planctomycetota bacterium]|nr:hypothetical protein [Planctomycetota bacterium]
MIRPLFGPILFVILGIALGVGLDQVRHTVAPPEDIDMENVRRQRMLRYSDRIEVLSVGNSHSLAVDMKAMDVSGFHMWMRGQDLFEVESILSDLLPRLPKLDAVFFTVSFSSFHRDNGACTDAERGMVRSLFYASSPHLGMIGFDPINYFKGLMTHGLVTADHWQPVLRGLVRRMQGQEKPKRQYLDMMTADGQLSVGGSGDQPPRSHSWLVQEAATRTLPLHQRLQDNMLENNPNLESDAVACMERIIALLDQYHVRAIFFTPPYYPAYTQGVEPETREAMQAHMTRFVDEFGIEYHDFSRDPELTGDPANFVDSGHMSSLGAKRFSANRLKPLLQVQQ